MSEPSEKNRREDHRKAREWWQENAHRYTREGVSNNRSGRGGVDVDEMDSRPGGQAVGRRNAKRWRQNCVHISPLMAVEIYVSK